MNTRKLFNKWSIPILMELNGRTSIRYSDLQSRLDKSTPRIISMRLNEFQELGIIKRQEVGYSITPYGRNVAKLTTDFVKNINKL